MLFFTNEFPIVSFFSRHPFQGFVNHYFFYRGYHPCLDTIHPLRGFNIIICFLYRGYHPCLGTIHPLRGSICSFPICLITPAWIPFTP